MKIWFTGVFYDEIGDCDFYNSKEKAKLASKTIRSKMPEYDPRFWKSQKRYNRWVEKQCAINFIEVR